MAAASKASGPGKRKAQAAKAGATKSGTKKTAAKKAAAKKTVPGNSVGKKTAAKKAAAKKTVPKKTVPKKTAAKKSATKKAVAKKAVAGKKTVAKKTAPSAGGGARSGRVRSPFGSKFLEQMRKLLVSERQTYERQAAQLKAEAASLVADLDPGDVQFDEESGEGDTIAVERGQDLAMAAMALEMVEEIDHALSKFDLGTYGICEISGEPIPEERLEAIPWARERVEYKVGGFGRR